MAMSEWYGSQYALVPRLIEIGRGRDVVLVNFPPAQREPFDAAIRDAAATGGYRVAWRDGRGMALLARERP